MRKIRIKTAAWKDGYKAWNADDPKQKSTSTCSARSAAENLATRLFLGHNKYAQLDAAELEKVIVSQTSANSFLATYDK